MYYVQYTPEKNALQIISWYVIKYKMLYFGKDQLRHQMNWYSEFCCVFFILGLTHRHLDISQMTHHIKHDSEINPARISTITFLHKMHPFYT